MYLTREPCADCVKLLEAAGLDRIEYPVDWKDHYGTCASDR